MLKGDSHHMDFNQLMAQAAQFAKQQDATLAEKAEQKRRDEEEKRRKEERDLRERREAQAALAQQREKFEMKQKMLLEQKRYQREIEKQKLVEMKSASRSRSTSGPAATARKPKTSIPSSSQYHAIEKKKPVHMSFDQLMRAAKEIQKPSSASGPLAKPTTSKISAPSRKSSNHLPRADKSTSRDEAPGQYDRVDTGSRKSSVKDKKDTPTIYHKRASTTTPMRSTEPMVNPKTPLSARDKIRMMYKEPMQKLNTQKRDRRSVSEIQRDLRHARGVYSDEEEDPRRDPRLMTSSNRSLASFAPVPSKYSSGNLESRQRQMLSRSALSPPPRATAASQSRPRSPGMTPSAGARAAAIRRRETTEAPRPTASVRRMPFSRSMDSRRMIKPRRPLAEEEEEEDEDLASFIVDDDEEEADVYSGHNYSDEISRLFRYDKRRFANETYSDDDMEADASEVLREEKRSARIARREDLAEERAEMERLKRRKMKGKNKA
ncbi:SPT2 chromatin protein-domain-containing protein [Radiomyces spectabilis]|uniref:SPT2 chromatin protein-domain-containing protein n=1 Tax=Radiomyces spectabilis TaxID=64574 RepID=UPI00221F6AA0|nr:SPT2 chromatin protein-domain-containing protein [Radiomyces spectabilis]KAI8379203.1 SPT2 chromatin protein-domain-containing protein [Radiomyces spectabilis]